jgi:SAM-dependent methyltransferase
MGGATGTKIPLPWDEAVPTAVRAPKLVLAYAAGIQVVYRAQTDNRGPAIDLACGPGHYTLCLARYLGYDEVTGIDLSAEMVERAPIKSTEPGH